MAKIDDFNSSMTLPRLYPIIDTQMLAQRECPVETAAKAMLEGGIEVLQFRHKGNYTRTVFEQAEQVAGLCQAAGVLFIIDDRADIALMLNAGLHVGQDDLPPQDARRLIGPERILGYSTHNAAQLEAASGEPVDYMALGPIFGTMTKEKADPVVGVDGFRQLRQLTQRPLVAIGGITRDNALSVLEAGADSLAVIGDLLPEVCTFETLHARMGQWQQLVKKQKPAW
jgi:thiamine-phosphate pyrophosphorylase